jgi:hypothetical protein
MRAVSRSTALVFVVLGAAFAGFAFSSASGRFESDPPTVTPSIAATPQTAQLYWRETYGEPGDQLVFGVQRLEVLANGWRAWLVLTNETSVSYEVGDPRATLDRAFGLMLFRTGDAEELERRNSNGTLPAIRAATRYDPSLPIILEPGDSWRGTIWAPGSLVAGSWARVVFGTLLVVGENESRNDESVVWITDHAYRLQP